jgi:hypothetical protein
MKGFQLDKWFLDFIDDDGRAMIFYAARMHFLGISIPYGSWIHHQPGAGTQVLSKFRGVHFPIKKEETITWGDPDWNVSGIWHVRGRSVSSVLHDSGEGHLDWKCFQPSSRVRLELDGKQFHSMGYAEHLTLTIPPWKIPMDQLRWGHFCSSGTNAVWIEIIFEGSSQKWFWLNGDRVDPRMIGDDAIEISKECHIELDRAVILESEAKFQSVARDISDHLPGFSKMLPTKFLLANEKKWLSAAKFKCKDSEESGWSIHELVNFG